MQDHWQPLWQSCSKSTIRNSGAGPRHHPWYPRSTAICAGSLRHWGADWHIFRSWQWWYTSGSNMVSSSSASFGEFPFKNSWDWRWLAPLGGWHHWLMAFPSTCRGQHLFSPRHSGPLQRISSTGSPLWYHHHAGQWPTETCGSPYCSLPRWSSGPTHLCCCQLAGDCGQWEKTCRSSGCGPMVPQHATSLQYFDWMATHPIRFPTSPSSHERQCLHHSHHKIFTFERACCLSTWSPPTRAWLWRAANWGKVQSFARTWEDWFIVLIKAWKWCRSPCISPWKTGCTLLCKMGWLSTHPFQCCALPRSSTQWCCGDALSASTSNWDPHWKREGCHPAIDLGHSCSLFRTTCSFGSRDSYTCSSHWITGATHCVQKSDENSSSNPSFSTSSAQRTQWLLWAP